MGQKGELVVLIEGLKEISLHIKSDLEALDDMILRFREDLLEEKLDRDEAKKRIDEIRQKIGKIEEEDEAELKEEETTHSILEKLDALIDKCIDR